MHLVATRKSEQNSAVVDPWTAVHLSTGLALGLMAVPFKRSVIAATLYEAVEQVIERQEWGQELFESERPENALNAMADVAVFAVGHWLGTRWNRT